MKKWIPLLLAAAVGLSACGQTKGTAAAPVVINQVEVGAAEYRMYLYESQSFLEYYGGETVWETDFDGRTGEELAKQRALSSIQAVKLSCEHAADYEVSLTEEEKATAAESGVSLYEGLTEEEKSYIGLAKEDYSRIMEENALYQKVYEAIGAQASPTEEDFQTFYANNADLYRETATYLSLSTILVEDEATAKIVYDALLAGEDFGALSNQYEMDEAAKEDMGKTTAYLGQLKEDFGWDISGKAVGDILAPVQSADGYYIVRVDEMELPEEREVEEYARNYYTSSLQAKEFETAYAAWEAEAEILIAEDVIDQLMLLERKADNTQ